MQFCRFAPFGNQNWSISGPVQGGGIRFPEDRGGVEATRRVKLNGAEMKIGTKIVQKRSEMFGPVGFPIGDGRPLPQQLQRRAALHPAAKVFASEKSMSVRNLISLGWPFALSLFTHS